MHSKKRPLLNQNQLLQVIRQNDRAIATYRETIRARMQQLLRTKAPRIKVHRD